MDYFDRDFPYAYKPAIYQISTIQAQATPVSGVFRISLGGLETADINFDDDEATIQAAINLLAGYSSVSVSGSSIDGGFVITFTNVDSAVAVTITNNTMIDALSDPVTVNATVNTEYKAESDNPEDGVTINDINKAIDMVCCRVNRSLFCSDSDYKIGFMFLTAHFLVTNLRNSSAGLSGKFAFIEQSKSVGSVSVANMIPQGMQDDMMYQFYAQTTYGMRYLEMILPASRGAIFAVAGATTP